jgi:hypothetical protein
LKPFFEHQTAVEMQIFGKPERYAKEGLFWNSGVETSIQVSSCVVAVVGLPLNVICRGVFLALALRRGDNASGLNAAWIFRFHIIRTMGV